MACHLLSYFVTGTCCGVQSQQNLTLTSNSHYIDNMMLTLVGTPALQSKHSLICIHNDVEWSELQQKRLHKRRVHTQLILLQQMIVFHHWL
jgi:hypothetical protein